jgi:hypothetical protein
VATALESLRFEDIGQVLRSTFDQLYDGARTGRYRWDQLHKTEKTHFGTLVEINLQRAFKFPDGTTLDYTISGIEVDCKFSQTMFGWMIPPEARGELCLAVWASDVESRWSMGLVRASLTHLNQGGNRDGKATLNDAGRCAIRWIYKDAQLPPNVLLQLARNIVDGIMQFKSGQKRVNELFRHTLGKKVGRGVVATAAQQEDYMKRIRGNGGARSALRAEGIVILGQYSSHREIARKLSIAEPGPGESVPVRLALASAPGPGIVEIEKRLWRVAVDGDIITSAPILPRI